MDKKKLIGLRIKDLRIKRGLTQEKLSEKSGLNPKHVGSLELGKENPTLNTLIKIAESLETDLPELFNIVDDKLDKIRNDIKLMLDDADTEQLKKIKKIIETLIY